MKSRWHSVSLAYFWNGSAASRGVPFGFTLLELLVVIAIIAVIVGMVAPTVTSMMKGSQLTQGALMINDQLHLARQTALSKNRSVEVRFYQYGVAGSLGEQATNPASGHFRAIQLFEVRESGDFAPVAKALQVPDSIIIDAGVTLSSLIGGAATASKPNLTTGDALNLLVPRIGRQYNCVSFRFLPGGATDLPKTPGNAWFLTLHELRSGDRLAPTPPANFFTIQIDPFNGHVKNHRP